MKQKGIPAAVKASPSPKGGFRHSDRASIPETALSFRERKVLDALRKSGKPLTVRELARSCFPGMRAKSGTYQSTKADGSAVRHATAKAYRCVLNSLRRLVAGGFVEKCER